MVRLIYNNLDTAGLGPAGQTGLESSVYLAFYTIFRVILIVINGVVQRFFLGVIFFFLLSVAERTFKQVYFRTLKSMSWIM